MSDKKETNTKKIIRNERYSALRTGRRIHFAENNILGKGLKEKVLPLQLGSNIMPISRAHALDYGTIFNCGNKPSKGERFWQQYYPATLK